MGALKVFAVAVLAALLVEVLKGSCPKLALLLIRGALRILREDQRERYRDEWISDTSEIPGTITKIWFAAGFFQAAFGINSALPSPTPSQEKHTFAERLTLLTLRQARVTLAVTMDVAYKLALLIDGLSIFLTSCRCEYKLWRRDGYPVLDSAIQGSVAVIKNLQEDRRRGYRALAPLRTRRRAQRLVARDPLVP